MTKFLLVTSKAGYGWHIPAEFVARDRAEYYAARDETTTLQGELDYAMGDHSELTDWFENNMNWADVAAVAVRVMVPPEEMAPEEVEYVEVVEVAS